MFNRKRRQALAGYLFSMPAILGFLVFFAIPFMMSFILSFNKAGLLNYEKLFSSNSFQLALKNTGLLLAFGVPLLLTFSYILALSTKYLIDRKSKMGAVLFSLHLCAMLLPSSIVAHFIHILFSPKGAVNALLRSSQNFYEGGWIVAIFVMLYIWKNYSYSLVIFLAGLYSVPTELYESAALDGAGGWKQFWCITFPLLSVTLFFNSIMAVIGMFKIFRESYLLFGNYPPESVYMISNFLNNSFLSLNMTGVSIAANVLFVLFGDYTVVFLRYSTRSGKSME